MSREIKFRLRSPIDKIVGYEKWYSGCLDSKNFWTAKPCWLYSKDGKKWDPAPIEHRLKDQYIGFKDKNGKAIWESSIVKCNDFATGKSFNCKVIYVNGCFFLAIKNSGYMPLYKALGDEIDSTISDLEVIGNIYENLELVTK